MYNHLTVVLHTNDDDIESICPVLDMIRDVIDFFARSYSKFSLWLVLYSIAATSKQLNK